MNTINCSILNPPKEQNMYAPLCCKREYEEAHKYFYSCRELSSEQRAEIASTLFRKKSVSQEEIKKALIALVHDAHHRAKYALEKYSIICPEELLGFDNTFQVSYFQDNKMYERNFTFAGNTIAEEHLTDLPLINKKGILAP